MHSVLRNGLITLLLLFICSTAFGSIIYVDSSATGENIGISWEHAFTDLQDALDAAASGPAEIWVATGTYRPSVKVGGTDDRHKTFQMISGVEIYGGFPSGGGTWPQRDPEKYTTVLSGDIGIPGDSEDNCYHVFYHPSGINLIITGILDGFTITAGNANGLDPHNRGGGMYNENSGPTVANCTFADNTAAQGGGLYNYNESHPKITHCVFSGNSAGRGGGMYNENSNPSVAACQFSNNSATEGGGINNFLNSDPVITSCTFSNNSVYRGGGLFSYLNSNTTLNNCTFSGNSATLSGSGVWAYNGDIIAKGIVQLNSDDFDGDDIKITGDGAVDIDVDSNLNLDNSRIFCNISGTGTIQVDLGAELIIQGDAVIDMAHANPVTDPDLNGTIHCEGLLRIKDNVQLRNTNIIVARTSFEGDVDISNSVITAEAASPYGQFFIEDSVTIAGNDIHADGDRYMDLDPSVFAGVIANNRIWVTITEGVGNTRGGLLELRGEDGWTEAACEPNSFFCKVYSGTIPVFNTNTWTLEELRITEGAKVSLTNRFDFGNGGVDEVMYVKELVMEPNSVLNTSFNRLYYDADHIADSAMVKNEPLLGFSLNNIACDDENEFVVRVVHTPDYLHPSDQDFDRIHVQRIEGLGPDPNGMMRMCTLKDKDPNSATYEDIFTACAKGLFAKCSENEILIWFEYLFDYDPNIPREDIELVVYLSEDPNLAGSRIEVGHLMAPPPGRPGSVGSGRFGTFHKFVNTQGMDFLRGTRIELELLSSGDTCVYINNFDPQVWCRDLKCGDVTGDLWVTVLDYLTVVGEYGTTADVPLDGTDSRACLDSLFSGDGYVDLQDVAAWDWLLNQLDTPHFCTIPMTESFSASASATSMDFSGTFPLMSASAGLTELPGDLLIAGKRPSALNPDQMEDSLYVFDQTGLYQTSGRCALEHSNTRLIQNNQGRFYQINLQGGIIPLADANSILSPCRLSTPNDPRYGVSSNVLVGLQGEFGNWTGRPIQDAVFDDAGYLYVVPVVVDPNTAEEPYMAIAKLMLSEDPNELPALIQLYDDPPEAGDNQERNALRELEIDSSGYLYVINAHTNNESSILWVYDTDNSLPVIRLDLGDPNGTPFIPGPLALYASKQTDMLFLASSLNVPDANSATLYQMSTIDFSVSEIQIPDMGHITDVTEEPNTGDLWVSGFTMSDIPEYPNLGDDPFYKPYAAHLLSGGASLEVLDLALDNDPNNDLALPISIQWIGQNTQDPCEGADIDGNGAVGISDLAMMAQAWLSSSPDENWDQNCDLALDNEINLFDFAVISRNWLEGGCQ